MKKNWQQRLRRWVIRAATGLALSGAALASEPLKTPSGYAWKIEGSRLEELTTGMLYEMGPRNMRSDDLPGYCKSRSTEGVSFKAPTPTDVELLETLEAREIYAPLTERQFYVLSTATTVTLYDGSSGKVAPYKNRKKKEISGLCVSYSKSSVFSRPDLAASAAVE
jgi:hypothetical protein